MSQFVLVISRGSPVLCVVVVERLMFWVSRDVLAFSGLSRVSPVFGGYSSYAHTSYHLHRPTYRYDVGNSLCMEHPKFNAGLFGTDCPLQKRPMSECVPVTGTARTMSRKRMMVAIQKKFDRIVHKFKEERDLTVELALQHAKTREEADTRDRETCTILGEFEAVLRDANNLYVSSVDHATIEHEIQSKLFR